MASHTAGKSKILRRMTLVQQTLGLASIDALYWRVGRDNRMTSDEILGHIGAFYRDHRNGDRVNPPLELRQFVNKILRQPGRHKRRPRIRPVESGSVMEACSP